MLPKRIVGIVVVTLSYLIPIGLLTTSSSTSLSCIGLFLIITQTIFSAEVLVGAVKAILYYFGLRNIEYDFYNSLIKNKAQDRTKSDALLLDLVMDYECLKSYYQIAIPEKIFKANNEQWSKEWDALYSEIQTAENCPN